MKDEADVDATAEARENVRVLVARARAAQALFEAGADQSRYDRAALAAAWTLMQPDRNRELAEQAVRETGLGNVADKITKNHRKTLGLLRDIRDVRTCGVIAERGEDGITEIARPLGVVAAVVPSTNPVATPVNNIVNALKCGNAIILSPSPAGAGVCARLLELMGEEFARAGVDPDLVQMLGQPSSKAATQALMEMADGLVVTGSQDNVRRAYSSGTPAIGVGAGNVVTIVDETADAGAAARLIAASKCFDNATSCSSENALVVVEEAWPRLHAALEAEGGRLLTGPDHGKLVAGLFRAGKLNREMIARDAARVLAVAGIDLGVRAAGARFLMLEASGVGVDYPLSGEKLSPVLAVYRVANFSAGEALAGRIMAHQGAGHSVGIHTGLDERAVGLGLGLPTCRVIVNQAHCFATGGSFDNAMPFSLSMGCGSWGRNSIDDNVHWRHFMNVTKVVRRIAPREPAIEEIFGGYWRDVGQ
ncbi:MAG: aldehyde dehydrogenase family protein [Rhizobiales bacterium]|nr:aldehyde dehydrogenase family protein [Hyphomicrobiales bacterium]